MKGREEPKAEVKYHTARGGFYVGQDGVFTLHDSFNKPIEQVEGKIVSLMEGKSSSLYAMLMTERGLRPGRLS